MDEKKLIIFIPFAYGGNPAAESGPKCIFDMLQTEKDFADVEMICIHQRIDESPLQFLSKTGIIVANKLNNNYHSVIFVGGNHLSILPIYSYFYNLPNKHTVITLDAHRDYYPDNTLNHATFMKYLPNKDTVQHYLIGSRDFDKHEETNESIIIKMQSANSWPFGIELQSVSLLDIDLDVIDPEQFPWCGAALSGGLSKRNIDETIMGAKRKGCHVLALSEYIPNWDTGFKGAKMIISFIRTFLHD